jgi:hypothetical protein
MPNGHSHFFILRGINPLYKRPKLVQDILKRVIDVKSMIIRSTPISGKTTLLSLLASEVIESDHNYPFEPVYLKFANFKANYSATECQQVDIRLDAAKLLAIEQNSDHRRLVQKPQIAVEVLMQQQIL